MLRDYGNGKLLHLAPYKLPHIYSVYDQRKLPAPLFLENEGALSNHTSLEGSLSRVVSVYDINAKTVKYSLTAYFACYLKINICGVRLVYPETVTYNC